MDQQMLDMLNTAASTPDDTSSYVIYMWLLCGTIGTGMFIYGKNMQRFAHIIAGIALMVLPHVVTGGVTLLVVGLILIAAPFFLHF